jgi:hypothetical protein
MISFHPFDLRAVAKFLGIWPLLFVALPGMAQEAGLNLSGASNCTAADFDVNVGFANGPGNSYGITIEKRNISTHPCILDSSINGPTFVPERVSGDRPFDLCYDCENRTPNGQYPIRPA